MENIIKLREIQKELTYEKEVILTYKIQYPEIIESSYSLGKEIFNSYNEQNVKEQVKYIEGELFKQAKEVYHYHKEHGYPIMIFELILETNITYNQEKFVSLYQDRYLFQGGAHGTTLRTSQNWDLQMVKQIPLYFFYQSNPYFLLDILKQINQQIETNKENYFEDYCSLVLDTFHPESYYITSSNLVIYFQQYDIAPYSSGIPQFQLIR